MLKPKLRAGYSANANMILRAHAERFSGAGECGGIWTVTRLMYMY